MNAQLTVGLAHRLTAIGIPKQFQSIVIAAVESGTVSSQAKAYHGGGSLQAIVNEVVSSAYGAFGAGLDLALILAASMLLLACVIAAVGLRGVGGGQIEPGSAAGPVHRHRSDVAAVRARLRVQRKRTSRVA